MRSKTLITAAVVSTIGWSAASFAGPSHEVVTPFSPNESGENVFSYHQGVGTTTSMSAMGATSDHGAGIVSGSSSSDASSFSSNSDETAAIGSDDSFAAADEGLYTDYYVVSWAPVSGDSWDYYVIDDGGTPTVIGLSDYDVLMPAQQLVLIPSTSDEMTYELALIPMVDESDVTGE